MHNTIKNILSLIPCAVMRRADGRVMPNTLINLPLDLLLLPGIILISLIISILLLG